MVMMIGKRCIIFRMMALPPMMIGTLSSSPKTTSAMLPLAAAAMATELSRLITKSAMMIVRIASIRLVDCLMVPSSSSSFLGQELHADPQQKKAADQFQRRHRQQGAGEENQQDPQPDGPCGAPEDAKPFLTRRQVAAGQRDDDGVVAPEDDVDRDDLKDRNYKSIIDHAGDFRTGETSRRI